MKKVKVGDNLEVEGLEELEGLFLELPVAMQKECLTPAVQSAAEELTEEVRDNTPVSTYHHHTASGAKIRLNKKDSIRLGLEFKKWGGHSDEKYGHRPGFLRDSIAAKHFTKLNSIIMTLVGYGRDAFYGYFIEKGTTKMKGIHFMKKSFDRYAPQGEVKMAEVARDNLSKAIDSAKSTARVTN